jgi:centrosome and spindle pole-associated protein 1
VLSFCAACFGLAVSRKVKEEEKRKLREQREEEERRNYNPFGRGGAGAPLRQADGQIVTNLRNRNPVSLAAQANRPALDSQSDDRVKPAYSEESGLHQQQAPAEEAEQQPGQHVSMSSAANAHLDVVTRAGPEVASGARKGFLSGLSDLRAGLSESQKERKEIAVRKYQQELQEQMRQNEQRKKEDLAKRKRQEAEEDKRVAEYNPWGKAGAGAPHRDAQGQVVSNLKPGKQQVWSLLLLLCVCLFTELCGLLC